MPLNELASCQRSAGTASVLRKLARDEVSKVFIADDADEKLKSKIKTAIGEKDIPVEYAENSQMLGRACALSRKTAVAAILKKVD